MSDMELKESGYSAFERFLYLFFIPFVFTSVLVGVLLSFFNYDVLDALKRAGNRIPVLERIVPDPKPRPSVTADSIGAKESGSAAKGSDMQQGSGEASAWQQKAQELEQRLAQTENDLKARDEKIADLTEQLSQAKQQLQEQQEQKEKQQQRDSQYGELAKMYAAMTASKAAPILENMAPEEAALILNRMKTDERGRILERMDPKRAAEITALLKQPEEVLAERVAKSQAGSSGAAAPSAVGAAELGATFENMNPRAAAELLVALYANNPDKALAIMRAMSNAGRSRILNEMIALSKPTATAISSRLGG